MYSRNEIEFNRSNFRVKGDTIDVYPAYADYAVRVVFFGDDIEEIHKFNPENGRVFEDVENLIIYPANIFVTTQARMNSAMKEIQLDLGKQINYFNEIGKPFEAKRIKERVEDIEMMKNLLLSGVRYSRYFDGRPPRTRPFVFLIIFL